MTTRKGFLWVQLLVLLICLAGIGYGLQREDFTSVLALYIVSFLAYCYLAGSKMNLRSIQVAGIALRFMLVFSIPELSDDFYRFLWDGQVWSEGMNPYLFTPQKLAESGDIGGFSNEIYPLLNSPNYFTVYPPLNQYLFILPSLLFPDHLLAATIVLKLQLFLFEVGTILLLPKTLKLYGGEESTSAWYILNPLIILELTANAHFEGVMVFFMVAFLYYLGNHKHQLASLALGLAINVKLIPLLIWPLLAKNIGWKKSIYSLFLIAGTSVLLSIPFVSAELIENIASSIGLYFRGFSFNAFIYSIVYDFFPLENKKLVAPLLMLIPLAYLLKTLIREGISKDKLPLISLHVLVLYFLFSAVVHPWYLAVPLVLSLFTSRNYLIAWTGLVFLTYFTYRIVPYEESPVIIAFEYCFLLIFITLDYVQAKRKVNLQKAAMASPAGN